MNILFFAKYRELLGAAELSLDKTETINTVADLKAYFLEQYKHEENWQQVFGDKKMICAVNQEVAQADQLIQQDDEIAFFPPVTGG